MQLENLRIFDDFCECVCIVDCKNNTFRYLNDSMQKIFGYKVLDLQVFGASYLDHLSNVEGISQQLNLLENDKLTKIKTSLKTADGKCFVAEVKSFVLSLEEELIGHKISVCNLICNSEKPLDKNDLKLKLVDMINTKKTFFKNLNHEMKTPLHCIIAYSDMLKTNYLGPLSESQCDYVEKINTSGLALLGLFNKLLDVTRSELEKSKLDCEYFSITSLYNDVISSLQDRLNFKKQEISLAIKSGLPRIYADFNKCYKILHNLVTNAIEYSPTNAKIEVNVDIIDGESWSIAVKDYGVGISAEDQEHLFENKNNELLTLATDNQFQEIYDENQMHLFPDLDDLTLEANKKEIKTGLYLTKKLVEMHSGTLELDSELGLGSTFYVKIPLKIVINPAKPKKNMMNSKLINKRDNFLYE